MEKQTKNKRIPFPENAPFEVLGYSHKPGDGLSMYYYRHIATSRIFALCAEDHSIRHLLQFASLEWFSAAFPGPNQGPNFNAVVDCLYGQAEAVGKYQGAFV